MDIRKLISELKPEETRQLAALLPEDVFRQEAESRGLIAKNLGGIVVSKATTREELTETTEQLGIRRPIYKNQLLSYMEWAEAQDPDIIHPSRSAVMKTWFGLVSLNETEPRHSTINIERAQNITNASVPVLSKLVQRHSFVNPNLMLLDEHKSDGLDMDQTARYFIGILKGLRKRHPGQPLDYQMAVEFMKDCLPKYTFIGCKVICDYIVAVAANDHDLPNDIELEQLQLASRAFAIISSRHKLRS